MTLQKLDLDWALTAALPPLDFVLPGLLPGSLGLLIAPGATGKSTLTLDIAISTAIGRPVAGGLFPAGRPGKVVVLAGEECERILAERMRPMLDISEQGSPFLHKNLCLFPMAGESSTLVDNGRPTSLFTELQDACADARLIVVDPLRRMHSGDENSSADMTSFVVVMEQLAKATGAAVLGVHHANRASSADAASQHAARGSTALVDGARWQLNLSRMDASTAKDHLISEADRVNLIALDFAKTNYLAPQPRQWLKRQPGGRLVVTPLPPAPAKAKAFGGPKTN
jgi:RecA-family ATPase